MSREQLEPIDVSSGHIENRRHGCEWLMIWTYGFDDLGVSQRIKNDIQPFFPELKEVFTSASSSSQIRGYIFLKVQDPTFGFSEALLRVEGVGGIVGSDVEKVKVLHDVQPLSHVWEKDLIRVIEGPLQNTLGRVEGFQPPDEVKVVLDLLGRPLSLTFKLSEVQSVGRVLFKS